MQNVINRNVLLKSHHLNGYGSLKYKVESTCTVNRLFSDVDDDDDDDDDENDDNDDDDNDGDEEDDDDYDDNDDDDDDLSIYFVSKNIAKGSRHFTNKRTHVKL